jgi:hypothetical protein
MENIFVTLQPDHEVLFNPNLYEKMILVKTHKNWSKFWGFWGKHSSFRQHVIFVKVMSLSKLCSFSLLQKIKKNFIKFPLKKFTQYFYKSTTIFFPNHRKNSIYLRRFYNSKHWHWLPVRFQCHPYKRRTHLTLAIRKPSTFYLALLVNLERFQPSQSVRPNHELLLGTCRWGGLNLSPGNEIKSLFKFWLNLWN